MFNTQAKIAIVYDWIDKWGGVERVLLHLHSLFPSAHFYTSAMKLKNAKWARELTVHTSFIQSLPSAIRSNRVLLASLYPYAFESFRFDEYDLVISVTSAFAKGIITKPGTTHVCYLLTPPRYLWSHNDDYLPGLKGIIGKPFLKHLRAWDIIASTRPDGYICLSETTARRALHTYTIKAPVVFPPFDTGYWHAIKKEALKPTRMTITKPYFLWVGRMESYKKPDLVMETARRFGDYEFVFVGIGSLMQSIKRNAPQNCQFLGLITDCELSYLYSHAKALIMPQNEDFGYVSLEAQYHGCPVIAYRAGGACETIIEGESGTFFDEQTAESLSGVLERFEQISYNLTHSTELLQNTIEERFGVAKFDRDFIYNLKNYITL